MRTYTVTCDFRTCKESVDQINGKIPPGWEEWDRKDDDANPQKYFGFKTLCPDHAFSKVLKKVEK